jgi:hypothetical protein
LVGLGIRGSEPAKAHEVIEIGNSIGRRIPEIQFISRGVGISLGALDVSPLSRGGLDSTSDIGTGSTGIDHLIEELLISFVTLK